MTRKARPTIGARLSGLVEGVETLGQPATMTLPTGDLQPGTFQPRTHFDPEALAELARSIREQGVLQPLLVRPVGNGRYEIVAGERRWRAAQQVGLLELPVLVRQLSDEQAQLAAAVENLQRENLNVMEEVRARLQVAASTLGISPEQAVPRLFTLDRRPGEDPEAVARLDAVFAALGRETWRSFVKNRAALLNLPQDLQKAVREGLDYRKALVIGRVSDSRERAQLLQAAVGGATVQALRDQIVSPGQQENGLTDSWHNVVRRLANRKVMAGLDGARQRKIERLLRQIAEVLDGA